MDLADVRCQRKVSRNLFEFNDPQMYKWWQDVFKSLEAALPVEKDLTLLKEILPLRFVQKVLVMLGTLEREPFIHILNITFQNIETTLSEIDYESWRSEKPTCSAQFQEMLTELEKLTLTLRELYNLDLGVRLKLNPYRAFFKRKHPEIWRDIHIPSKFPDNVDYIAENIAIRFVDWYKKLDVGESRLNVRNFLQMFEIGSKSEVPLNIEFQEICSVPEAVADILYVPHLAKRTKLRQEILRDLKATKKPKITVAFGQTVPQDLQVRPNKCKYYQRFLSCDRVPIKLKTMETAFLDVTHLASTTNYIKYIMENKPKVPIPSYVRKAGFKKMSHEVKIIPSSVMKI